MKTTRTGGKRSDGIYCLEDLRQRCVINSETGCWNCRAVLRKGRAQVWYHLPDGTYKKGSGCRAAVELSSGAALPRSHTSWTTCAHEDCANPKHCASGTRAEWGAYMASTGSMKGQARRVAANRANGLKRRVLTQEQAAEMVASDEHPIALAKKYGASLSTVLSVLSGVRYRYANQTAVGSVFAWRPA